MADRLNTEGQAESVAQVTRPVLLAFFDFPDAPTYTWSGIGTISWDGHDFVGVGTFGEVSSIEETTEVRATGASFQLSGVPSELIADVLGTSIQGQSSKLWLGFMNEDWTDFDAEPILLFSGIMDTMELTDGGTTATITLLVENRLRDLDRPRIRRYTDADQQLEYPSDVGFNKVPSMQEYEIRWGALKIPPEET